MIYVNVSGYQVMSHVVRTEWGNLGRLVAKEVQALLEHDIDHA